MAMSCTSPEAMLLMWRPCMSEKARILPSGEMAAPKVRFSGGLKVSWRSLIGPEVGDAENSGRQRGEVAKMAMRSSAATVLTITSWPLRGLGGAASDASVGTADL